MKKIITFFIMAVVSLSLVGCKSKDEPIPKEYRGTYIATTMRHGKRGEINVEASYITFRDCYMTVKIDGVYKAVTFTSNSPEHFEYNPRTTGSAIYIIDLYATGEAVDSTGIITVINIYISMELNTNTRIGTLEGIQFKM